MRDYSHLSNEELLAAYRAACADWLEYGAHRKVFEDLWFTCVERVLKEEAREVLVSVQRERVQQQAEQLARVQRLGQLEEKGDQ